MKAVLVLFAGLLAAGAVSAGDSACADCHRSNPDLPSYPHIQDWQASIHGHNDVGCEQCHDGDATTFRKFLAHRDMVRAADSSGPLHSVNLPATCGKCHTTVFNAFATSSHGALLAAGDTQVPTCTSCHGPLALQGIGGNGLQVSCGRCHGPDGGWPDTEMAVGGDPLEAYREATKLLKRTRSRVRKVRDGAVAHDLEAAVLNAAANLSEAIDNGHAMDLQGMLDQSRDTHSELELILAAIPKR